MNEFANSNQRGVELPPGCKDLMDVLSLAKEGPPPPDPFPQIASEAYFPPNRLEVIKNHILMLIQPPAPAHWRSIWIDGTTVSLGLHYGKPGLHALIFFAPEHDASVRVVLYDHGIKPIQDDAIPGQNFISCALKPTMVDATPFVCDLLRRGLGVPDYIPLKFRYREKAKNELNG
jgi:hypothetical protein